MSLRTANSSGQLTQAGQEREPGVYLTPVMSSALSQGKFLSNSRKLRPEEKNSESHLPSWKGPYPGRWRAHSGSCCPQALPRRPTQDVKSRTSAPTPPTPAVSRALFSDPAQRLWDTEQLSRCSLTLFCPENGSLGVGCSTRASGNAGRRGLLPRVQFSPKKCAFWGATGSPVLSGPGPRPVHLGPGVLNQHGPSASTSAQPNHQTIWLGLLHGVRPQGRTGHSPPSMSPPSIPPNSRGKGKGGWSP